MTERRAYTPDNDTPMRLDEAATFANRLEAEMADSRYPYTYAADYVRVFVSEYSETLGTRVPTISRSEASQARKAFATALGMTDEELARKLADAYLRDQDPTNDH